MSVGWLSSSLSWEEQVTLLSRESSLQWSLALANELGVEWFKMHAAVVVTL